MEERRLAQSGDSRGLNHGFAGHKTIVLTLDNRGQGPPVATPPSPKEPGVYLWPVNQAASDLFDWTVSPSSDELLAISWPTLPRDIHHDDSEMRVSAREADSPKRRSRVSRHWKPASTAALTSSPFDSAFKPRFPAVSQTMFFRDTFVRYCILPTIQPLVTLSLSLSFTVTLMA